MNTTAVHFELAFSHVPFLAKELHLASVQSSSDLPQKPYIINATVFSVNPDATFLKGKSSKNDNFEDYFIEIDINKYSF